MAYSSAGKQVYTSLNDLPQYSTIGAGDKLLIYNSSDSGPAVVDFGDIVIDIEQCTFKSIMSEMIELASDIQAFVNTASEDIENLQTAVETLQNDVNLELRSRIKVLEYLVAVIIGANSWHTDSGLSILYDEFVIKGITGGGDTSIVAESEEKQHAKGWYNALITAITDMISRNSDEDISNILLQSKFDYRNVEVTAKAINGESVSY